MNINFNPQGGPPQNLLARILTVVLGALLLGLSFMFSLVVFAVIAVAGLVFWLYFMWKTRALRQQIRAQMEAQMGAQRAAQQESGNGASGFDTHAAVTGEVIEGEAVRVDDAKDSPRH